MISTALIWWLCSGVLWWLTLERRWYLQVYDIDNNMTYALCIFKCICNCMILAFPIRWGQVRWNLCQGGEVGNLWQWWRPERQRLEDHLSIGKYLWIPSQAGLLLYGGFDNTLAALGDCWRIDLASHPPTWVRCLLIIIWQFWLFCCHHLLKVPSLRKRSKTMACCCRAWPKPGLFIFITFTSVTMCKWCCWVSMLFLAVY